MAPSQNTASPTIQNDMGLLLNNDCIICGPVENWFGDEEQNEEPLFRSCEMVQFCVHHDDDAVRARADEIVEQQDSLSAADIVQMLYMLRYRIDIDKEPVPAESSTPVTPFIATWLEKPPRVSKSILQEGDGATKRYGELWLERTTPYCDARQEPDSFTGLGFQQRFLKAGEYLGRAMRAYEAVVPTPPASPAVTYRLESVRIAANNLLTNIEIAVNKECNRRKAVKERRRHAKAATAEATELYRLSDDEKP